MAVQIESRKSSKTDATSANRWSDLTSLGHEPLDASIRGYYAAKEKVDAAKKKMATRTAGTIELGWAGEEYDDAVREREQALSKTGENIMELYQASASPQLERASTAYQEYKKSEARLASADQAMDQATYDVYDKKKPKSYEDEAREAREAAERHRNGAKMEYIRSIDELASGEITRQEDVRHEKTQRKAAQREDIRQTPPKGKEDADTPTKREEFIDRRLAEIERELKDAGWQDKPAPSPEVIMAAGDRESLVRRNAAIDRRLAEIDQELKAVMPLIAVSAEAKFDRRDIAETLAEKTLDADLAKSNLIAKIWKGKLFRKQNLAKYKQEFLDGREIDVNGKASNIDDIAEDYSHTTERFVIDSVKDMHKIQEQIYRKGGMPTHGEFIPADQETNDQIRLVIEIYAREKTNSRMNVADLNQKFSRAIDKIIAEAIKDGRMQEGDKFNNYLDVAKVAADRYKEVAIAARTSAEQQAAMESVMDGFQVYLADSRSNLGRKISPESLTEIAESLEKRKVNLAGRRVTDSVATAVTPKNQIRRMPDAAAIEDIRTKTSNWIVSDMMKNDGKIGAAAKFFTRPANIPSDPGQYRKWWDNAPEEARHAAIWAAERIKGMTTQPTTGSEFIGWLTANSLIA